MERLRYDFEVIALFQKTATLLLKQGYDNVPPSREKRAAIPGTA